MFSRVSSPPSSLRLRTPPPPPLHSFPTTLPSPTSPNIRSPRTSPLAATMYATAETTCFAQSLMPLISPPSLYEILGISIGATGGEIKTAYRKLARTSHPDVKDSSGEEFMKIHSAYSTLSDPDKRANYDRRLIRMHRSRSNVKSMANSYNGFNGNYGSNVKSMANSYNGFNGNYGGNWETDQCW